MERRRSSNGVANLFPVNRHCSGVVAGAAETREISHTIKHQDIRMGRVM